MSRLRDATEVERPLAQAQAGLQKFLASLRGQDGVSRLRLHVSTNEAADAFGISLDRAVCIEARPIAEDRDAGDSIEIAWSPEGAVVFPRFNGTLIVSGRDDCEESCIELNGSFTAPVDAGRPFDATIGERIAYATSRALLTSLKEAIEDRSTPD